MESQTESRSSVAVTGTTLERLKAAKPYSSMSSDEFINVMLDRWEAVEGATQ